MINAILLTFTPLIRWKKSIYIVIKKEKENFKINRLRIIDKFEGDYNLIVKLY